MSSRFRALIALFFLTSALHAQQEAPSRFQLYGGYSFLSNSLNGLPGYHHGMNGWEGSLGFPSKHGLRFKIDVTGYSATNVNAPQKPYYIMGGGQYNRQWRRETVFVEGLAGDAGANRFWGANQTPGQTASFAAFMGGGLDTPVSRHFSWRVEGGYQYSYFALLNNLKQIIPYRPPGLPTNFGRVTTGLVWKF
jgi:hypothetical protein